MYMSWSTKYKKSIDCDNPKGFSQKAHCDGRKKNEDLGIKMNEKVEGGKVICDKCDWKWDISDGGKDPYTCHKCGNDNTPIKEDILSNTKNKVVNWLEKTKHFVKNNWEEFKSATDREKKETIVALHIFQRMIMGEEVSETEKRFLKSQSKDVVKILFLVSFKFVPSPIPITPITIYLGKKVGINILPSSHSLTTNEDLRKWFGKGKWGGKGGGGWDRYNSKGERIGKCGGGEEGEAYAACLSSAAADKLGKKGRANFVNRKRAAQKAGGDAKKGGEKTDGDKPIRVRWDKSGKKDFNPPA